MSRQELLVRLWGVFGSRTGSRTVDMHVSRLRGRGGDGGAELRRDGTHAAEFTLTVPGLEWRSR